MSHSRFLQLSISGLAVFLIAVSTWFTYRSYLKSRDVWLKYLFFYSLGMVFLQATVISLFFSDLMPVCCRGTIVMVARLFRFVLFGIMLYAYPVCILHAVRISPSSKVKLVLFVISLSVLVFGIIVLIWQQHMLSNVVEYFFYLLIVSFSIVGIVRQKFLISKPHKKSLLVLLYVSVPYVLWVILSKVIFSSPHIVVHIIFSSFFGILFIASFFRWSGNTINDISFVRRELYYEGGITGQEEKIILMLEKGMTNKEIAAHFTIDDTAVDSYIFNIYKKLNVNNRIELFKKISGS